MKHNQLHHHLRRWGILATALSACLMAQAQTVPNTFLVHKLVSDLADMADKVDPNLVNPWGNGFGATPFWVGNNGTGTSTLYDGAGNILSLVVSIPGPGGATTGGKVTGVIYNLFSSNTAAFAVAPDKPAIFLFCGEDGIISGWNSGADSSHALVLYDNSAAGAIYKGCALGGTAMPRCFRRRFSQQQDRRVRWQPDSGNRNRWLR